MIFVTFLGNCIAAMATCWKGVVMEAIKNALKLVEDPGQDPITVVGELLSVKQRLHQTTVELFGGHSLFLLTIKQAFIAVFRSLTQDTGLRVSGGDGARVRVMVLV